METPAREIEASRAWEPAAAPGVATELSVAASHDVAVEPKAVEPEAAPSATTEPDPAPIADVASDPPANSPTVPEPKVVSEKPSNPKRGWWQRLIS
jgi:hypothetical protein